MAPYAPTPVLELFNKEGDNGPDSLERQTPIFC